MALAPGRPPPWPASAMIPLVAGLLNWATNQLAVKMMFYPQRWLGPPLRTRVGWQGIVPAKATQMANDIVDDVIYRLINVSDVFQRLRPRDIAKGLPDAWYTDLAASSPTTSGMAGRRGRRRRSAARSRDGAHRGRALVASIVLVQAEVGAAFDLRSIVVRGIASDTRVLVELFERCGGTTSASSSTRGSGSAARSACCRWGCGSCGTRGGPRAQWRRRRLVTDQLAINAIFLPVEEGDRPVLYPRPLPAPAGRGG